MNRAVLGTDTGVIVFGDGSGSSCELDGRPVRALANAGDMLWAVVDARTISRRDGAGTWTDVVHADTDLSCLAPAPDGAWVGTGGGHLLRLLGDRLTGVEGFDQVAGRDTWKAVPSGTPSVRSITTTADHRALLASVHVGGIPRSGNGGASWKPTIAVETDVHEVRAHGTDPRLVLAPAGHGLAVSRDAGVSWTVTTEGLHADYLRAVAFTTEGALVSASDGPVGGRSALYRWTDDDGPMTKVSDGLPEWLDGNVDTGALDASGQLAVFADASNAYRSTDGGRSWSVLGSGLGRVRAVAVRSDES